MHRSQEAELSNYYIDFMPDRVQVIIPKVGLLTLIWLSLCVHCYPAFLEARVRKDGLQDAF